MTETGQTVGAYHHQGSSSGQRPAIQKIERSPAPAAWRTCRNCQSLTHEYRSTDLLYGRGVPLLFNLPQPERCPMKPRSRYDRAMDFLFWTLVVLPLLLFVLFGPDVSAASAVMTATANRYQITWYAYSGTPTNSSIYTSGPGDTPPYHDYASGNWTDGTATEDITTERELREVHNGGVFSLQSLTLAAVTYKITFTIPAVPSAAAGGVVQHYEARKLDNTVIATYNALPGDPQSTLVIDGLANDDPITLNILSGYLAQNKDLDTGLITITFVPTGYLPVAAGEPLPGAGAIVGVPTLPGSVPTAPTAAPTPQTPTAAPTSPTPTTPHTPSEGPSNPTPSGSDPAKKEDVMASANQISDRVREAGGNVVSAVNKNVEATDKVTAAVADAGGKSILAIDKVSKAVNDSANAQISAANKLQITADENKTILNALNLKFDKLDATNGKLEDLKSNTQATVNKLTSISDTLSSTEARHTAGETAAASAASGSQGTGAAKSTEAQSAFNSAATVKTYAAAGSGSSSLFALSIPTGSTHRSIDTNPFVGKLGKAFEWIKWIAALFIGFRFTLWAIGEVQQVLLFGGILGPARGNTVAGSGGQITSTLVATWTTVVLLTAPTALFALFVDSPAHIGAGSLSIFGELNTFDIGNGVIYFLNGAFPLATMISAMTSYLVIRKGSVAVYLGISAAIRWFIA